MPGPFPEGKYVAAECACEACGWRGVHVRPVVMTVEACECPKCGKMAVKDGAPMEIEKSL